MSRQLSYAKAILEATDQAMTLSKDVVLFGQLVDTPSGIFGTTTGLVDKHGTDRVLDFPVSENLMTANAMGAALTGLRPILAHQRLDFMIYSLDALANWLALWRFKSNGQSAMPVTIRTIVGKGWGQGPQHSKSLHSWFAHLPGLRVAMPATAYDAKGLLLESIFSESPAIFVEGRGLYSMTDHVPEEPYRVRFGQAIVRRPGRDVTLVALGHMVPLALRAAAVLEQEGVDVEVVDPRTLTPLDRRTICDSAFKTGRLVVADPAWHSFGAAGEIITTVCENLGDKLKSKPVRVTLPDSHTPMS
ncbi:MAG TPA: transketolase C-terminal domain-containing protein, partial [Opitutaceae bacterium]|nr:transketolase C-terminal domain-containing protein [Opitutaceae bacterium]